MHRPTLIVLAILLLTVVPSAEAAWTTSASVPSSFRPNRDVTFSYTAASSSGADLPVRWRVTLYTCQDLDADTWCEVTDANRVDHGERTLTPTGGNSQTVTWTVNLNTAEGAYRYHFHTVCIDNPCVGVAAGGANNKTGAFQLAYTNTWTRTILGPSAVRQGDVATIQYKLQSTSVNDRDLGGEAALLSTPNGQPERAHGIKPFSVNANQQVTLTWTGIDFPTVGPTTLRVAETPGSTTSATVQVRAVHLHVTIPRERYTAGNALGVYLKLEGHGASPDPQPLDARTIVVRIFNGSLQLAEYSVITDTNGLAYVRHETAEDDSTLAWTASTSVNWQSADYDIDEDGAISVTTTGGELADNVSAIREDLEEVRLKGVHLDDVGARNLWMSTLRAVGAVALVILLCLLVIFIAFRV